MTMRWLAATVHLLALVIGTESICVRAWSLRTATDPARLRTAFAADSLWGLAALLWIGTGMWRAFGGLEKGSAYHLSSAAFWVKMALLLGVLVLEGRPMVTLIRWRIASARGTPIDLSPARTLTRVSIAQVILIAGMVVAATATARGLLQ